MNIPCFSLLILVFASSVKCMYNQESHGIPRIQALARIGDTPAAAAPEIVIKTGRSSPYGVKSSQQALPSSSYGTNSGITVLINAAEEQAPYYPVRTVQL